MASLATLILGGVLGPEMPLVVIGMVLAVLIVHLIKKDAPKQAVAVIRAAGSFAAISACWGHRLSVPSCCWRRRGRWRSHQRYPVARARSVGCWCPCFVALSDVTQTGVTSFGVPNLPRNRLSNRERVRMVHRDRWVVAAVVGTAVRRLALQIQPFVARHKMIVTPVLGSVIGGLAVFFAEETGKSSHVVLFSGQSGLAPLVQHAATWSLGAIMLLIVCKGLAYSASMGASKVARSFPAYSSVPPSGSPSPTFPVCLWWTRWPWVWEPCPSWRWVDFRSRRFF